jgi:hypothetical protein
VVSILPFVRTSVEFDEETTRIMGEAFDAARASVQDTGQPKIVYGIIASASSRPQRRASVIQSACVMPD